MLIPINNGAAFLPSLCQGEGTKLKLCCFAAASPRVPWGGRNPALPFGRKKRVWAGGKGWTTRCQDGPRTLGLSQPVLDVCSPRQCLGTSLSLLQHPVLGWSLRGCRWVPAGVVARWRGHPLPTTSSPPPGAVPPARSLSAVLCGGQRGCARGCRHGLARATLVTVLSVCLIWDEKLSAKHLSWHKAL